MAGTILSYKWVLTDGWNVISSLPNEQQITKQLYVWFHRHQHQIFILPTPQIQTHLLFI